MTGREHLERSYRRLLAWYPREFRDESGPEILAVLMAAARDGQRRPGLAQSADLIRSGLRMRLRLRPGVPPSARRVRAAVRLMCAGAAVSTVNLILVLAVTADAKVYHAVLGHRLTAVQVSQLNTLTITRVIVSCLVPVAVWLWMAWANGQGRNWARVLFRMLFTLATWTAVLPQTVMSIRIRFVPVVYMPFVPGLRPIIPVLTGLVVPVLTGLVALAAMCLLWLPADIAFFRPGYMHALRQAQMHELARTRSSSELARIRSSSARWVRPV
jgi:hypothetical protein